MLRPVIVLAAVLALGACKREGAGDGADDSAPAGAAAGRWGRMITCPAPSTRVNSVSYTHLTLPTTPYV